MVTTSGRSPNGDAINGGRDEDRRPPGTEAETEFGTGTVISKIKCSRLRIVVLTPTAFSATLNPLRPHR